MIVTKRFCAQLGADVNVTEPPENAPLLYRLGSKVYTPPLAVPSKSSVPGNPLQIGDDVGLTTLTVLPDAILKIIRSENSTEKGE